MKYFHFGWRAVGAFVLWLGVVLIIRGVIGKDTADVIGAGTASLGFALIPRKHQP